MNDCMRGTVPSTHEQPKHSVLVTADDKIPKSSVSGTGCEGGLLPRHGVRDRHRADVPAGGACLQGALLVVTCRCKPCVSACLACGSSLVYQSHCALQHAHCRMSTAHTMLSQGQTPPPNRLVRWALRRAGARAAAGPRRPGPAPLIPAGPGGPEGAAAHVRVAHGARVGPPERPPGGARTAPGHLNVRGLVMFWVV